MEVMRGKGQQAAGHVVFITRQYGGTKLGFKRFQIVKELTSDLFTSNKTPSKAISPPSATSNQQETSYPKQKPNAITDINIPPPATDSQATNSPVKEQPMIVSQTKDN